MKSEISMNQNCCVNAFISVLFMLFGIQSYSQMVFTVTGIEELEGYIVYGLYNDDDPSDFLGLESQLVEDKIDVNANTVKITIDSLPAGNYAMSIFHDVNSDGKMDKNFIGYPKESFGFSQNYKPMLRAPKFEDAEFYYDGKFIELEIILID